MIGFLNKGSPSGKQGGILLYANRYWWEGIWQPCHVFWCTVVIFKRVLLKDWYIIIYIQYYNVWATVDDGNKEPQGDHRRDIGFESYFCHTPEKMFWRPVSRCLRTWHLVIKVLHHWKKLIIAWKKVSNIWKRDFVLFFLLHNFHQQISPTHLQSFKSDTVLAIFYLADAFIQSDLQ